jgi:hypothetical protein
VNHRLNHTPLSPLSFKALKKSFAKIGSGGGSGFCDFQEHFLVHPHTVDQYIPPSKSINCGTNIIRFLKKVNLLKIFLS